MRLPQRKSNVREATFKTEKTKSKKKIHAPTLMKKRPNLSENWIEAQASIKVNFHLNALTVEELDTTHLSVLIRRQRIRLKRQRKPYQRTGRKGIDTGENHFMLSKTIVHLNAQMNPPMKREPLNLY